MILGIRIVEIAVFFIRLAVFSDKSQDKHCFFLQYNIFFDETLKLIDHFLSPAQKEGLAATWQV
jgi:hypothetical protein